MSHQQGRPRPQSCPPASGKAQKRTQRWLTAQLGIRLQCCFLWETGGIQGPAEAQKSWVSVQMQVEGPQYGARGRVSRKGA